jgi:hypothetical protein
VFDRAKSCLQGLVGLICHGGNYSRPHLTGMPPFLLLQTSKMAKPRRISPLRFRSPYPCSSLASTIFVN